MTSYRLSEDFMKKPFQSMWTLGTLALLLTVGVALNAQQSPSTPPTQPSDPTAQQPATPPQGQTPDQGTQAAPGSQAQPTTSTSDNQTFTGTIAKSGDKYVLQDASSGKTYDVDHQDQLKQYEGKKVRVHGTLDASGTMIHLQ
jgi:hypothetical protein